MLSPGSKGWINKYFALIESGSIKAKKSCPNGVDPHYYLHLLFAKSGIIFGFPSKRIFQSKLDDTKWTQNEKLKVLLFEAHLLIFQQKYGSINGKKEEFIQSLLSYYSKHGSKTLLKSITFFIKESDDEKLEDIYSSRTDIKLNLFENKWWVSTLNNVFVYLDVILYHNYLHNENTDALDSYSEYAYNALTAIALAAHSDGTIEEAERSMFEVFLASANLPQAYRKKAFNHFKNGVSTDDFTPLVRRDWLFKRFIIDLSMLTIVASHEAVDNEISFLNELGSKLNIPEEELEECMVMVENFVIQNNSKVPFLKNSNSYAKVYNSLSSRWGKVILRNKDKLAAELKESKQLVGLITKSTTQELTKEEKELVKSQFMDIVKSMPALAIFMLPGGAILLPLILKLLPDLVPSAFKENEIDKKSLN